MFLISIYGTTRSCVCVTAQNGGSMITQKKSRAQRRGLKPPLPLISDTIKFIFMRSS